MCRKTLSALVAAVLCSAAAFSEGMATYLKGTLGFEHRYAQFGIDKSGFLGRWGWDDYIARFALNQAFGMVFAPDSDSFFVRGLGLEAGLGIGFGALDGDADGEALDSTVISFVPRVSAVWHLPAGCGAPAAVPHALLGFSLPVQVPLDDRLVSSLALEVEAGIGVTFGLTERIGMVADFVWTLPFGSAYGTAISAGVTYRLR